MKSVDSGTLAIAQPVAKRSIPIRAAAAAAPPSERERALMERCDGPCQDTGRCPSPTACDHGGGMTRADYLHTATVWLCVFLAGTSAVLMGYLWQVGKL